MQRYYPRHLSGNRLRQVYDLAPPRIRQYLEAESRHVEERVRGATRVLELGCGYGRVLRDLAPNVYRAIGNDTSPESLRLASFYLRDRPNCDVFRMNAVRMGFRDETFDAVLCLQNGISAFGVNRSRLVAEAARVAKSSGWILFSSYSPRIWGDRLEWFRAQSQAGLVGEIDEARTRGGTIVCTDGFRSETVSEEDFRALFRGINERARTFEIDRSSVFAEARKGASE